MKAEDQTILTFHERVVASNGRFSVSHENYRTWYLHIRDVEETDKGCYMCQVNTIEMQKQISCLDVLGKWTIQKILLYYTAIIFKTLTKEFPNYAPRTTSGKKMNCS